MTQTTNNLTADSWAMADLLLATGGQTFFNTSKMDLSGLGQAGIKANLESCTKGFS